MKVAVVITICIIAINLHAYFAGKCLDGGEKGKALRHTIQAVVWLFIWSELC